MFHGRKGISAVSRLALLDSLFKDYQQVCLGTVQTTLNVGTVFVTLYPNFNLPLSDPFLHETLKIQAQIIGAPMVEGTSATTIHYPVVHRVENYALDLCIPYSDSADALLVKVDSNKVPHISYITKQLANDELLKLKLLPESWINSYKTLHEQAHPVTVHTAEPTFTRKMDKTVEVRFNKSASITHNSALFMTEINIIKFLAPLPLYLRLEPEPMPIHIFIKE